MIRLKRVFLYSLFLFIAAISFAQILEPAKWNVHLNTADPKKGDTIQVVFDVDIDDQWYLYSSDFDPTLGPIVAEFEFNEDDSYELLGDIEPINPSKAYDSLIWEGEYTYFKKRGQFIQLIKILDPEYMISGFYTYQVCSDLDGKCITSDEEFDLSKKKITQDDEDAQDL
ncbi:MAG: protein-disulfide reductase DsbD domain-containing protein [Bacteroidota bacterium]